MTGAVYTTDCEFCGEHVLLDEDDQLLDDECDCSECPHGCGNVFGIAGSDYDDDPQEVVLYE